MKQTKLFLVILGSLLAGSLLARAQENGLWRASSSTAQSITGDIIISDERLTINFSAFVLAKIRLLNSTEVSSVFDADAASGVSGHLYRLKIPAAKKFQHKNTLCGSEDVEWMATFAEGRELHVAFFSSAKAPVFARDAIQNSSDLCGIFTYAR